MAVQPVGRRESVYWPTLIPGTSVIEPVLVPLSTSPKASPREALAAPIPAQPANAKAKSLRLIANIRHLLERATKKAGGSYSRQRPRSIPDFRSRIFDLKLGDKGVEDMRCLCSCVKQARGSLPEVNTQWVRAKISPFNSPSTGFCASIFKDRG